MVSAKDLDIDDLKGMPNVKFDFGVSSDVKSAFRSAANALDDQRGQRSTWRSNGAEDFKGHFADVFNANGATQLNDLDEIVTALKGVVTVIEGVESDARAENDRRKTARDWAQAQENRSGLHKAWDSVFGGDDPPDVEIKQTGPTKHVAGKTPAKRETPGPGSSSGSGGTMSSARPSDLRTFATKTSDGDDTFSNTTIPGLGTQCDSFASHCSWATLDASGPIDAFKQWLKLNGDDATWAKTVAEAFAKAGGEGNISSLPNSAIKAALAKNHVAVNRTDIKVDPPTALGSPPTTGYSDDPINTATGNFIENESDLGFSGPADGLSLLRTYNSLNTDLGAFGPGWSSAADAGLTLTDEAARLRLPDGRVVVFPRLGDGWDRANGENLWLAAQDGGYLVTNSSGLRWELTGEGRLGSTSTGPGTKINFEYDDDGRLTGMGHQFGRTISLQWDEQTRRVIRATSSDGRRISYQYDDSGRLTAAETPAGTRTYRWNDDDLIIAVIDADGVVEAENTYDPQRRVVTQRSPYGRLSRFAYLAGGVTAVSDEDGTRANTWLSDGKGRLVGVIDADDHRQSTSYDRWGNPVMISERNGALTVNSYDDRGRRVEQVMPSGARARWTYDDADRPLTATAVCTDDQGHTIEATTRYSYQGESRDPSRVVDPEGGVTLMTWDDGLLKQVVDPEGVTLRFDHDDHGDLIATTDADGNVARLERDDLGRVTAAITPLGSRTTYRYDGTGPLLSRQDPDGAIWRYETTAGGRVTAAIDPLGARTEIEYGSNGEQERLIDQLGDTVTTSYDDLGNLARTELPDGTAWEFGYDAMSRLTSTTDAAGSEWKLDYDSQGFVRRTVDPTGVEQTVVRDNQGRPTRSGDRLAQVATRYDALGRTVSATGTDGSVEHFGYDLNGLLIEHTDPTGATTRIQRDAAGRPVAITHPMGTTYRYEYDACGRRSATIDTDGTRYDFSYDADGRLIREDWPTGEQATLRYDACGRVIERSEPGRGVATYRYDKVGRLIGATDGWYGRRRMQYDAAGQLVAVTNAAGGTTHFEYDSTGQCVAVVDPLGGRTERRYDAVGQLIAETDPLGRTTRFGYDAAGRQTRRIDPTGSELSWSYDDTGRLADSFAGTRLLANIERDFAHRTLRVSDGDTINELVWDKNGRLSRRMRSREGNPVGGIGLSWSYDGDGRRSAFTHSDGTQTRYEYDQAGRVTALTEPGLGRAVIDRDAIGRIVSMTAPGLHATWTWDGGAIVRHQVTRNGVIESTEIERDDAGRVIGQSDRRARVQDGKSQPEKEIRTSYGYDETGQLIEARRSDGSVTAYTYDASGRLVRETTDGRTTSYSYDRAGQLLSRRGPDGVTDYRYDAAGRRTAEAGPEGERRFGWDPRGYLSKVTTITRANDKITARTEDVSDDDLGDGRARGGETSQDFDIDALGELASVNGTPVAWDSASGMPTLAQVGEISISSYGPLTALLPDAAGHAGESGGWLTPDWRPRSTGTDPWGVAPGVQSTGLPSGVAIGGQANLLVDGMEWMQARVYDPASRGFLSTDPLDPILGAGWAGNPYSFAGNDPLNQSDPWGLKPVTDKELQAYRDSNNGALSSAWNATTNWVKNNWEYIAAGAMIVGGVALMCTGIGGPVGLALAGGALSMGMSVAQQKATNGKVNWGQAGIDGLTGMIPIPGAGAAGALLKTGVKTVGKTVIKDSVRTAMKEGGAKLLGSTRSLAEKAIPRLTKTAESGCFVAGTQVLMGDGSSKNIEDVRVGDEVTAADPETGETHGRRVIETYVHENTRTYQVETSAGTVTSTAEHPFYVQGKGWVPVRELQSGDRLVDPKGSEVDVVSVAATGETATVYNINVDELHTYHVLADETWLRVHNACGPQAFKPTEIRYSQRTIKNPTEYEQKFREAGEWGDAPPLDAVRMPDNVLTSVDNTRLVAANRAGVDVKANVHGFDEPLPAEHVDRFPGRKGEAPSTWGDAVTNRIGRQGAAFRNANPYGTFTTPTWGG